MRGSFMGMDSMIYSLPSKCFFSKHIDVTDFHGSDEDYKYFEKHTVAYWRKWWGLDRAIMRRLNEDGAVRYAYEYVHRIDKEDLKHIKRHFEDCNDNIYIDCVFAFSKKQRKQMVKANLKIYKKLKKELKKGRNLYYECSY